MYVTVINCVQKYFYFRIDDVIRKVVIINRLCNNSLLKIVLEEEINLAQLIRFF